MQRARDIGVVVKLRLLNRWTNARARGHVRDRVEFLLSKQTRDLAGVAKIDIVHRDVFHHHSNVSVFDLRIVKIIEVVEDRDVMSVSQ